MKRGRVLQDEVRTVESKLKDKKIISVTLF